MKHMSVKELRDSGLLFEVNRRVLHPLGLALSVAVDDEDVSFGPIWDGRDDPEGFAFDEELFASGKHKLRRYMQERGQAALDERKKRLGFVEQTMGLPEE